MLIGYERLRLLISIAHLWSFTNQLLSPFCPIQIVSKTSRSRRDIPDHIYIYIYWRHKIQKRKTKYLPLPAAPIYQLSDVHLYYLYYFINWRSFSILLCTLPLISNILIKLGVYILLCVHKN